jgi:hypothetical protein
VAAFAPEPDGFGWDGYRLHAERERISSITNVVTPSEMLDAIHWDPPDARTGEDGCSSWVSVIVGGPGRPSLAKRESTGIHKMG